MDKVYRALVDGGAGKYFRKYDDAINYCIDFVMKNQKGELTRDEVKDIIMKKGVLKYIMVSYHAGHELNCPGYVQIREYELN